MMIRHGRRLALCLSTMALLGACAGSPAPRGSTPAPLATSAQGVIEPTPVVTPVATPTSSSVPASPSSSVAASSSAASPAGEVLPSILEVTCTPAGTVAGSSRVAVQRDGVHIRVRNTSGASRTFEIDGIGGGNAPDTEEIQVWALPISDARVWCGPSAATSSDWIPVVVVDPSGFHVRDQLDCSSGTAGSVDHVEGARGSKGDPVAVARRQITGLRDDDVVERAGYTGSDEPKVRVTRGGMVVAVGSYLSDGHGGWLITSTTSCAGSGLGWGS